jgi:hypothetical protein
MATLKSEDKEFESSLTIEPGDKIAISAPINHKDQSERQEQIWQFVRLTMTNGPRVLTFETPEHSAEEQAELAQSVTNIQEVAHAYLVCRKPTDEITQLVAKLEDMAADKRSQVLFEPAEPSFELSIHSIGGGLKVEFFVDAGNVETGIYRWDALGMRFFTNAQRLESFIAGLKADFNC